MENQHYDIMMFFVHPVRVGDNGAKKHLPRWNLFVHPMRVGDNAGLCRFLLGLRGERRLFVGVNSLLYSRTAFLLHNPYVRKDYGLLQ